MRRKYKFLLILFVLSSSLFAQDTITKKEIRKQQKSFLLKDRAWTAELPLWVPGFFGSFAYGDMEIEGEDGINPEHPIEPPPGGIFGKVISRLFNSEMHLRFFGFTKLAYEKNRLMLQIDGFTGSVGGGVKFNYNDEEIVQADFLSTNIRLMGGYKIVQVKSNNKKFYYDLYGYIGVRMNYEKVYSDLNGLVNKLDFSPFWVEPLIGLKNDFTFKRWLIILQVDYAGYFVKSHYSIQVSNYIYYRSGKITSFKFGWNHFYLNHKGTFLKEDYKIKTTLSGPAIGIVFHF